MSLLQVNTIRNKNGDSAPFLDKGVSISGVSTLGIVEVSSGIITASTGIVTYYGDAQHLQNVGSAITSIPTDLIVSGILTVTNLTATENISVANTITASDIDLSGSLSVGSSITGLSIYGNGVNLSGIVTSLVAGSNISISGSSGRVTVSANLPATGLYNIVEDTTPQLGGNLDLNSNNITGTGNININGIITSTSFVGNLTGTATTSSHTTITNDNSSTSNNYLTFVSNTSGNRPQKVSSTGLIFKPSTSDLIIGGNLGVTGIVTSVDYNSVSDISLKENIKPLENSLEKVCKLQGVSFDWKRDGSSTIGLIAQEVEKIYPELVGDNNGIKTLSYSNLVAVLIESIKELKNEIEELKK